ncbi:MAG: hypothetical protein RL173_37 [Fibrobacterota bacterium]|jgi:hypothetical protein
MNKTIADAILSSTVELCLYAHEHLICLGEIAGTPYRDPSAITDLILRITSEIDPSASTNMVILPEIGELLDLLDEHEDEAMAACPERTEEIHLLCKRFDFDFAAITDNLEHRIRVLERRSPAMREIEQALADRGLPVQVIALTQTPLRERLHARKLRRRWLRTEDGRAYLKQKSLRRRRHHHIDADKSRLAKKVADLYKQVR